MEEEKHPGGRPIVWDDNKKQTAFETIIERIANGESLREIVLNSPREEIPSFPTFFQWISQNKELSKQYACACEIRSEILFDEMLYISDNTEEGEVLTEKENGTVEKKTGDMTQHRKLKIDTRKWILSKMNPKRFGDKLDITSKDESISTPVNQAEILESIKSVLNGGSIPES